MNIRLASIVLLVMSLCAVASAATFDNETIQYKVLYKWGLIHKQAGTATLTLKAKDNGSSYHATAIARSASWAERIYKLRDTLHTTMNRDLTPLCYERIAHEDGKYSHDIVTFSRTGNNVLGHCQRWRRNKKETTTSTATTDLSAQGTTVDIFSSFYYLRALPYQSMTPGTTRVVNIFSGRRKELLTFTFVGQTSLKINGHEHQVYKVLFKFTSDGKKESSDPIEAWVSTSPGHIPLKLVGKLKIGQVQCIYTGL